jgi:Na+:H+ antiporter, NhaA family
MLKVIRSFLKLDTACGIILVIATLLAFLVANSPFNSLYQTFFNTPFSILYGQFSIHKPLLFWINDCLMVIFFFTIGLEIKREFLQGYLAEPSQRILPFFATVGGVALPAIIYFICNYDNPTNLRGWAIPTATDIAFALAILSLLGKSIPHSLKIFLMTIAILDDLSAVLIIALFYAAELSLTNVIFASLAFALLIFFSKMQIKRLSIYVVISIILWMFVLKSGVHATVAGVLAAFTIPLTQDKTKGKNPLIEFERVLHPWVTLLILPVFAFANAGVPFTGLNLSLFTDPLPLGIILGLFVGKQLGVFLGSYIPVKLKLCKLPQNTNWKQIYGISVICGVGFTMSLFIGTLAFESGGPIYGDKVRLGILIASLTSAVIGYLVLKLHLKQNLLRSVL